MSYEVHSNINSRGKECYIVLDGRYAVTAREEHFCTYDTLDELVDSIKNALRINNIDRDPLIVFGLGTIRESSSLLFEFNNADELEDIRTEYPEYFI